MLLSIWIQNSGVDNIPFRAGRNYSRKPLSHKYSGHALSRNDLYLVMSLNLMTGDLSSRSGSANRSSLFGLAIARGRFDGIYCAVDLRATHAQCADHFPNVFNKLYQVPLSSSEGGRNAAVAPRLSYDVLHPTIFFLNMTNV